MPIAVPRSITNGRQPRDLVRWESDASKSILRKNSHPSTLPSGRFIILFKIIHAHAHARYFYLLQRLYRADKIKNVITVVNENENNC